MTPLTIFLPLFGLLASTTYGLVFLIRKWAIQRQIMDIPNERSSHSSPTPRGGGLAIVLIVLIVVAVIYWMMGGFWKAGLVYLAGSAVIAFLGWRDDIKSLPARVRFLVHGLVAIGTIIGLGAFDALPFPFIQRIPLGIFGYVLTFIWIIGLTNAFNFMDGIDGLAGGIAFTAGIGWIIFSGGSLIGMNLFIALAVSAACLGFLLHNWPPAKIFMGDVASGFLGYTFAVLPLMVKDSPHQPLMVGILLVWVFIIDAGVTFIRRAKRRERLFTAHRSHLYQRMVIAGYSHRDVTLTYILLNLAGLAMALGWMCQAAWAQWAILVGIPIFWIMFSYISVRPKIWSLAAGYYSLYQRLGLGWVLFRVRYFLKSKLGILLRESPAYTWESRPLETWVTKDTPTDQLGYDAWRRKNAPKWLWTELPAMPTDPGWDPRQAVKDASRILNGEWRYFSHDWINTGFPPDWHLEPLTGIRFDPAKHWSTISETGNYDIKYAWEASRLSMVYTLVRAYAINRDERYPQAFWKLMEDWMEKNQPNQGINWIGGQEAALRLMALIFGWYAFRGSRAGTPERTVKLTCLAGALGEKMHSNLDFALHTNNNHSISEAFGLWLCGTIFPELQQAEKYRRIGRRYFEEQSLKQLFDDGGYAMYSINYQRFVLHICALALRLAEINAEPFSQELYEKLAGSAEFIGQLMEPSTGEVPAFGSNDGALVLPLNTCDYRDYRPVIQLIHFIATGERILPGGPWDEDLFWIYGIASLNSNIGKGMVGRVSFPQAGVTILRGGKSRAYIRCTDYTNRPSHADQLHVDLWYNGINLACDAGTYLYHGQGIWQNGLAGTSVHNTVSVDGEDQMVSLSRFTWGRWSSGKDLRNEEEDGRQTWQGMHTGYFRLKDHVTHTRTVTTLPGDAWYVEDCLSAKQLHQFNLQWLLTDVPFEIREFSIGYELVLQLNNEKVHMIAGPREVCNISIERGGNSVLGWRSNYYGTIEPAISVHLTGNGSSMRFWTIFLPEPYLDRRLSNGETENLIAGWVH